MLRKIIKKRGEKITKFISLLLLISLIGVSFSRPIYAQRQITKQQEKTEKIKKKLLKLGAGGNVKIKNKLYSGTTFQGYLTEANENEFVIVDKSGVRNLIKYSDVDSIGGRNSSTGRGILIGVGIVLAVIIVVGMLFVAGEG